MNPRRSESAVRLIVPFAAGGTYDSAARLVADGLAHALDEPVRVLNVPGRWGVTGAVEAARAEPDGRTLLWAQAATHGMHPARGVDLGYDPVLDFAPVALLTHQRIAVQPHTWRWGGLMAPARTPAARIERLHGALVRMAGRRDVPPAFAAHGMVLSVSTPAAMDRFVRAEIAMWQDRLGARRLRRSDTAAQAPVQAPQRPARDLGVLIGHEDAPATLPMHRGASTPP
jgi:tripartite-type tricarboxylate transporter receptor subunit TctC